LARSRSLCDRTLLLDGVDDNDDTDDVTVVVADDITDVAVVVVVVVVIEIVDDDNEDDDDDTVDVDGGGGGVEDTDDVDNEDITVEVEGGRVVSVVVVVFVECITDKVLELVEEEAADRGAVIELLTDATPVLLLPSLSPAPLPTSFSPTHTRGVVVEVVEVVAAPPASVTVTSLPLHLESFSLVSLTVSREAAATSTGAVSLVSLLTHTEDDRVVALTDTASETRGLCRPLEALDTGTVALDTGTSALPVDMTLSCLARDARNIGTPGWGDTELFTTSDVRTLSTVDVSNESDTDDVLTLSDTQLRVESSTEG
jgi:hypothetical protein